MCVKSALSAGRDNTALVIRSMASLPMAGSLCRAQILCWEGYLDRRAFPLLPNSKLESGLPHQNDQNCTDGIPSKSSRGIKVAELKGLGKERNILLSHLKNAFLQAGFHLSTHQGTHPTLANTGGDWDLGHTRFSSKPLWWCRGEKLRVPVESWKSPQAVSLKACILFHLPT